MASLWKDLSFALRILRKSPWVTLAAVVSLALGIGANTTIFTLLDAFLLHPLPLEDLDRLVSVHTLDENGPSGPFGAQLPMSYPNFEDIRDQTEVFSHLAATMILPLSMTAGAEPEQILGQAVTAGYFEMLGIQAGAGRFFLPEENRTEGRDPVVVLSHDFWQRRFGGERSVIGRGVKLNGGVFEIVGVAPKGFSGTSLIGPPDAWVPLTMHEQVVAGPFQGFREDRRALVLLVNGRLAPGVGRTAAASALETVAEQLEASYPDENGGRSAGLVPLAEASLPAALRGIFLGISGVLMVVVALVLLIACANVANLLLARATDRHGEIAVRLSLGAPRRRLMRQLLTEGVVLSLAGGLLGVAVAVAARDLLWSLRPPMLTPSFPKPELDLRVLLFTLGLSLVTGVIFGLAPAFRASNPDLVSVLKGTTRVAGGGRLWSLRNLLVIGQIALCLVALIGSALFLRSLGAAEKVDPGFDLEHLAGLSFNLGIQGYDEDRGKGFHRRALEAAREIPGVREATFATNLPLGFPPGVMRTVIPEGEDTRAENAGTLVTTDIVEHTYFDTFGLRLLRGRALTATDRDSSRLVAVVNETLAGRLWPDEDAVGKRFAFFGEETRREIVGVVRDAKYNSLGENPLPYLYLPLSQNYSDALRLSVRTGGDPAPALEALRGRLQEIDPDLPLINAATMNEVVSDSLWGLRLAAALLGVFGLLALLLAGVGIYGVMAYSVSLRNRELGIRMALGAGRREVLSLVLRRGLLLVAVGLGVGFGVAILLSRSVAGLLYGVRAFEATPFAVTGVALASIAILANWLPARRATAVDPATVIRED